MNSGVVSTLHFDINDFLNLFLLLEFTFILKGWMGGLRFPQPAGQVGWVGEMVRISVERSQGSGILGSLLRMKTKATMYTAFPPSSPSRGQCLLALGAARSRRQRRLLLTALGRALCLFQSLPQSPLLHEPFLPEPSPRWADFV